MWAGSRPPPFCWTAWSGWSTGAMTPPAWRCAPRGRRAVRCDKTKGRLQVLSRHDPRRRGPGGDHGHRPHPLGHPRRAQRHQRPPPRQPRTGRSPWSTTASSRTTLELKEFLQRPGGPLHLRDGLRRWWPSCMEYYYERERQICWRPWAGCCGGSRAPTPSASSAADYPGRRSSPPGRTAP